MHIWDDAYAVGNEKIDQQHEGFFALVNRFATSQAPLASSLEEILVYIRDHFATEEALMRQCGLVDEGHVQLHRAFEARMARYKTEHANNADREQIQRYMDTWISGHILIHDKALFAKMAGRLPAAA